MTTQSPALCFACTRLHRSTTPTGGPGAITCDAFPAGIPTAINRDLADHRRLLGGERDGKTFVKASGPRADFDFESWRLAASVDVRT